MRGITRNTQLLLREAQAETPAIFGLEFKIPSAKHAPQGFGSHPDFSRPRYFPGLHQITVEIVVGSGEYFISASHRAGTANSTKIAHSQILSFKAPDDWHRTSPSEPPVHPWSIRKSDPGLPTAQSVQYLQIVRGHLAAFVIRNEIESQLLAFAQIADSGAFDRADMDEGVFAAVIRRNEPETLL
jgi:hypothetical protein